MLNTRTRQRGDTLIEVLIAISVFSLLVIGALAIMARGSAAAQVSLETTLVRQEIDAQAESLRYLHDSYVAAYGSTIPAGSAAARWQSLMANNALVSTAPASDFSQKGTTTCPAGPTNRRFIINPNFTRVVVDGASNPFVQASSYAQVTGDTMAGTKARGMWIEAVKSPNQDGNIGYVDFHIRACWTNSGSQVPITTGTIVRLYDIRG